MYLTEDFINKIFRLGFLLIFLLVLLDILTYFFYPDTVFGEIFLATREQTPLTWVSAAVLLLISLSCATVYMKSKSLLWYFLSLSFLFFSMDDAVYFHERFSAAVQELVPLLRSFPGYSWIVLYLPILVVCISMLGFLLWRDSTVRQKRQLSLGFILLVVSLLLDMIDGWVGKDPTLVFCVSSQCDLAIIHLLRLLEEVLEVFGLGFLAYVTIYKNTLIS